MAAQGKLNRARSTKNTRGGACGARVSEVLMSGAYEHLPSKAIGKLTKAKLVYQ